MRYNDSATKQLIEELENLFPHQDVMCALGICYPQYWFIDTFEATYPQYIVTLKSFYRTPKKLWVPMNVETEDVEEWVSPYLNLLRHLITFAMWPS